MSGKVHPSFLKPENLILHQDNVWDRDYGRRGAIWSMRTRELPADLKEKSVLEAGVGNGKTLGAILRQGPGRVVAFDFSRNAVSISRELFKGADNVSFDEADIRALPYAEREFDVVILYFILNNLLDEGRKRAVSEACRVLKPGGLLLFQDFATGDFRESTGNTISEPEQHTKLKRNGLICHFFGEEEVRMLFAGFSNVEASITESKPIKNRGHLLRRTLTAICRK